MSLLRRKSTNPVLELEATLADLTARRDALDAKLATAAGELAVAVDERRQSLLDSDLSDEVASARRDAACRAARDEHGSLVDALSAIGGKSKRFGKVIVRAHFEPDDAIHGIAARRQHQDRTVGPGAD